MVPGRDSKRTGADCGLLADWKVELEGEEARFA
jgi:hypothetical protein